jgi:UDP-GlcNAc:undecaprenyl-phosphate GlcNAc-1-phosphate transferase
LVRSVPALLAYVIVLLTSLTSGFPGGRVAVKPLGRTPLNTNWIIFFAAFVLSLGLTPVFRKIALKSQFLDTPSGQLKKHTAPIPYLGGLAIYFSFLLVIFGSLSMVPPQESQPIYAILVGGTVVALMGLVDDLFSLSPASKFLFEIVAAVLLIVFGLKLEFLPGHPILTYALTIFWVLAVTNAVNIIDIMDGLAGGVAAIACLGFVLVPFVDAHSYVPFIAAALGGSVLGFLPYNYQPARIYMGDSGALFLGFLLSAMAMGHGYSQNNLVGLVAPLFILAVPLYDTALVMMIRFIRKRSMFRGSNDHLALRLRKLGFTVKQTVHTLWYVSFVMVLAAGFLVRLSEKRALIFILFFFFIVMLVTLFIALIPMDDNVTKIKESPFQIFLKEPSSLPVKKRRKK